MSATPTPRTDALDNEMFLLGSPDGSTPLAEMAKHARTLERELAVEREKVRVLEAKRGGA